MKLNVMKLPITMTWAVLAAGQFFDDAMSDSPSSMPTESPSTRPTRDTFSASQIPVESSSIPSLHGSGGTVPQKCYWSIMGKLMRQSKQQVRLTYRGVGSGTGQSEFIGEDRNFQPYNDFGAGDVALKQEQYEKVVQGTGDIMHFPVMMGAISFFHSVDTKGIELNLTPCVLAKILDRQIEHWSDPEIIGINGALKSVLEATSPIQVARRADSSGSTSSITEYLHKACPEVWPQEMVGKSPNWKSDTMPCTGSSGIVECIEGNPGSIGYIDSGLGHVKGLTEIKLENKDKMYLNSKEAFENDGILAAAESKGANLPESLDKSFAQVNLLHQPGNFTWPIVVMPYIYVRKDLRYMSPESQYMLKAFLKALYKDEYMNECQEAFEFTPIRGQLRELAIDTIANEFITDSGMEWDFELDEVRKHIGQSNFFFSSKRISSTELDVDGLLRKLEDLEVSTQKTVKNLELQIQTLQGDLLKAMDKNSTNATDSNGDSGDSKDSSEEESSGASRSVEAFRVFSLLTGTALLWSALQ